MVCMEIDCDYRNYIPALNQLEYHWVFTYDGTSFAKAFVNADSCIAQTPVGNTVQNGNI